MKTLKEIIQAVTSCDAAKTEQVVIAVKEYPLLKRLEEVCSGMNVGQGLQFSKSQCEEICDILVELQDNRPSLSAPSVD